MSDVMSLQLSQRGVLVLPKSLRETYNLQPGDSFLLLDLGGTFVLSPRHSDLDALADRITQALTAKDETLETMLQTLREKREQYGTQG